jgi:hypothetical protein
MVAIDGSVTAEMAQSHDDVERRFSVAPSGLGWCRHFFDTSIARAIETQQELNA